jgi:hypothetical protein
MKFLALFAILATSSANLRGLSAATDKNNAEAAAYAATHPCVTLSNTTFNGTQTILWFASNGSVYNTLTEFPVCEKNRCSGDIFSSCAAGLAIGGIGFGALLLFICCRYTIGFFRMK